MWIFFPIPESWFSDLAGNLRHSLFSWTSMSPAVTMEPIRWSLRDSFPGLGFPSTVIFFQTGSPLPMDPVLFYYSPNFQPVPSVPYSRRILAVPGFSFLHPSQSQLLIVSLFMSRPGWEPTASYALGTQLVIKIHQGAEETVAQRG